MRRATLPGHAIVPRLISHAFDGTRHESLTWASKDWHVSPSPASHHAEEFAPPSGAPVQAHLQRLREALELPGTTTDYHFAIQRCIEQLWKRRREEPNVLAEVEWLCWLDIKLVEARPATITSKRDGKTDFFRVLAFEYLIKLYEWEGYLSEALAVAEQAARFGQGAEGKELRMRLAQIAGEEP